MFLFLRKVGWILVSIDFDEHDVAMSAALYARDTVAATVAIHTASCLQSTRPVNNSRTRPKKRRLKGGIVSLACDGGVDAICAPSMANKQAYADAHGYDFIVDADAIDRSAATRSWSKLSAMRKHLPRYDFLLYVDVDAVVMNPETGLEDIVDFDYDPKPPKM